MNRPLRVVTRAAVLALTLGAAVTIAAAPAIADSADVAPTTWAWTDSQTPTTSHVKQSGDAPLGTRLDDHNQAHTSRVYATFSLSALSGLEIHQGSLAVLEQSVATCGTGASVELWRTTGISGTTSWNRAPTELERLGVTEAGTDGQCPGYIGFDVLDAVNAARARHDATITFEVRLAGGDETNPALFRTVVGKPDAQFWTNHGPTVSDPRVVAPVSDCANLNHPTHVNNSITLGAKVADPDSGDYVSGEFQVWPVGHEDEAEGLGAGGNGDGTVRAALNLAEWADGTVLAFAARATDQYDFSPWSRPCYLLVDRQPPAHGPAVLSRTYVEGLTTQSGGEGVPGTFRFDALGDREVVAFRYDDGNGVSGVVTARHPGDTATLTYTPDGAGPRQLTVSSIDAAGNQGPGTTFWFSVAHTAPDILLTPTGVGLPSPLTMVSTAAGVTDFSYQIGTGAEVKFPATNGSGTTTVTFPQRGWTTVTARTYAGRKLVGVTTYDVEVSDAPKVSSAEFSYDHNAVLGDSGTFTFSPGTAGVVSYQYRLGNSAWQTVSAGPDGTATLHWTADVVGYVNLIVQSVSADGSVSYQRFAPFTVLDSHPTVYFPDLASSPSPAGVGVPFQLQFGSQLPNVTGYAYTFDGGAEQIIAGTFLATAVVTPQHAGSTPVTVQAVLADGTRSPATTTTVTIPSGPIVTWVGSVGNVGGMQNVAQTFALSPGLPGTVSYRYAVDSYSVSSSSPTVAAAGDGTASVTYTPNSPGYHTLAVVGVTSNGTLSDLRVFAFTVRDSTVRVYANYSSSYRSGGIGVPGQFGFSTEIDGVLGYVYSVNGGAEETVTAVPGVYNTYVTITPDHSGVNTVTVRSLLPGGLQSGVTTYRFLVGNAPGISSAEYPTQVFSGSAGVAGDFTFFGGTPGIVSFTWQVDSGAPAVVTADGDGTATVSWTPPTGGYFLMSVYGTLADGTRTDTTNYSIWVQS